MSFPYVIAGFIGLFAIVWGSTQVRDAWERHTR